MSGKKIIEGLNDAIAFAKGDNTRGRIVNIDELGAGMSNKRNKHIKQGKKREHRLIKATKEAADIAKGLKPPARSYNPSDIDAKENKMSKNQKSNKPGKVSLREEFAIDVRKSIVTVCIEKCDIATMSDVEYIKLKDRIMQLSEFAISGQ